MAQILQTQHGLEYQLSDSTYVRFISESGGLLIFLFKKINLVIENAEIFPFFVSNLTFILLIFLSNHPWWLIIIYALVFRLIATILSHIATLFFEPILSLILYVYHNILMRVFLPVLAVIFIPVFWGDNWYTGLVYLAASLVVNLILKFTTENYQRRTKFNDRVVEKVLSSHSNNNNTTLNNNAKFADANIVTTPDNNFELIAQNIATIYYVISNSEFGKTLNEDQRLFATAICDVAEYLKLKEISLEQIEEFVVLSNIGMMKLGFTQRTHSSWIEDVPHRVLTNLTMQIEATIFAIDLKLDFDSILNSILENKHNISNTITQTLSQGTLSFLYPLVYSNVTNWIKNNRFQEIVSNYSPTFSQETQEEREEVADESPGTPEIRKRQLVHPVKVKRSISPSNRYNSKRM